MLRSFFLLCGFLILWTKAENEIQDHPRRLRRQVKFDLTPEIVLGGPFSDPSPWVGLGIAGLGLSQVDKIVAVGNAVVKKRAQAKASRRADARSRKVDEFRDAVVKAADRITAANRAAASQRAAASRADNARRVSISRANAINRAAHSRAAAIQKAAAFRADAIQKAIAAKAAARRRAAYELAAARKAFPLAFVAAPKSDGSCASCLLKGRRFCQGSCKTFIDRFFG